LGMTEEEMYENSKLWREENADISVESELPSMRSVGVTTGGISADIDAFEPSAEPVGDDTGAGGGEEGGAGELGAAGTESPLTQAGAPAEPGA